MILDNPWCAEWTKEFFIFLSYILELLKKAIKLFFYIAPGEWSWIINYGTRSRRFSARRHLPSHPQRLRQLSPKEATVIRDSQFYFYWLSRNLFSARFCSLSCHNFFCATAKTNSRVLFRIFFPAVSHNNNNDQPLWAEEWNKEIVFCGPLSKRHPAAWDAIASLTQRPGASFPLSVPAQWTISVSPSRAWVKQLSGKKLNHKLCINV